MAITPLPPAPEPSDSTSEFNSKAFAFVGALNNFVTETNAVALEVESDAATASAAEIAASASADAAISAANFKGAWASLTGALAIPASVSHLGKVWILTESVADVTAEVPGTSSKWIPSGVSFIWNDAKTLSFNAASMNGYPINTTSAAVTATLPASAALGDTITLTDYAATFSTNNLTINPNGLKINASTSDIIVNTNGASVTLVYIDSTQGWICVSGFSVNPIGSYTVNYLVVAGGGGGDGGGGGAGGLIASSVSLSTGTAYTITVGAGGAANTSGSNSVINTVATAIGGGRASENGGSGGGAQSGAPTAFGSGTAGQGNNGGQGNTGSLSSGGGGGAGAVGGNSGATGGNGGAGVSNSISGSSVFYAGGGGGGGNSGGGTGGIGGGGAGATANSTAGTANTGGGGGGIYTVNPAAGGSGIVIISYLGSQRGTGGTVTSSGGFTIHTFTSSGTYNA